MALYLPAQKTELVIGHPTQHRVASTGVPELIKLPYSARSAHLQVLGQTRSGKSRFLADLIRQDILNSVGLTLLDPHSELCDLVTSWLVENPYITKLRKKIHLVNFSDPSVTFCYNPLAIDHPAEAYGVASNVANALTRIYGGNDPNSTPLIKATLDTVCVILAQRRLPLAAAQYFFLEGHRDIRQRIIEGCPDQYYRQLGDTILQLNKRDFVELVSSTERRVRNFIGNPQVRRIFSVTNNTANLRQIMDEGHVLLLNTRKQNKLIDFNELRALGMLIVNNEFAAAFERDPKTKPRPHYLYVDEVQNYVSSDIENILSQAAKFGLFLTLSHQTLAQLAQAGEAVYKGVMSGTLLKAIFSIPMEDAQILADELFAPEVDFQKVKEKLKTPHVIGQVLTTLTSTSTGESSGHSESDMIGSGTNRSRSESETNAVGHATTTSRGESRAYIRSSSTSESSATGVTTTEGTTTTYGTISGTGESQYIPDGLGPMLGGAGHTQNEFLAESRSTSEMAATGYSHQQSRSHSESTGEAYGVSASESETHSTSRAIGVSTSTGESSSVSHTKGRDAHRSFSVSMNQAYRPIIEWMATQTYTLEEQRYELARRIAFQMPRHAFLALRRQGVIGFVTREMKDPLVVPRATERLIDELSSKSPWIMRSSDILPLERAFPELLAPQQNSAEPDNYFE